MNVKKKYQFVGNSIPSAVSISKTLVTTQQLTNESSEVKLVLLLLFACFFLL